MRTKTIIFALFLFCWGMAIACGYFAIRVAILGSAVPDGPSLLLSNHRNLLVKYSMVFIMANGSIGMFLLPVLAVKGVISLGDNYYKGGKYIRAKSNFILITLFLPACIFFAIVVCSIEYNPRLKYKLFYIFGGLTIFVYSNSIITLLRSEKE